MNTLLRVKDLRTYFTTRDGVVKAVDGVTYDIQEGETIGLVGESGCGKSVSALSILRLITDPPGRIIGGSVEFEGRDLLRLNDAEMRGVRGNRIAMVFQEPMTSLNPVLTIGRQLTEGLELHLQMSKGEARSRAGELLQIVGIPNAAQQLKSYPHQFSGGMRQRVMIAMALSCNPKLLIADEPTTALDVTIQAQILELLQKLSADIGTSVLIITHNLGVIARYANRVNVMYAGRIVESGTTRDLFTNPQHPYTKGLLKSVQRLDQDRTQKLSIIEGTPPDLINLPQGCAFQPRCTFAVSECSVGAPALTDRGNGHMAACFVD
ncbi:MAG: ABC transporter ATP-binding protein [Chloroflexota bacterium]|nr:ABC transporter ATP-binding protein [Chloroflexota bacterium]